MLEMDPYRRSTNTISRLFREWNTHDGIIIGVDFDDTVYDCHDKGFEFGVLIKAIKEAQKMGCTICVWTANSDTQKVRDHFKKIDITIDYYNESPIKLEKMNTQKPYFNLLLDDRAGLESAYIALRGVIELRQKYYET